MKIKVISKRDFFKVISSRYSVLIARKITRFSRMPQTPLNDLEILYRVARSIKPKTILEIGTHYGDTAEGLFINAIYANVYTVDISKEMGISVPGYQESEVLPRDNVGLVFKNKIPGIYQIIGDSRDIETYSVLKGKTVDFVFIDGNHSFEAVIRDTRNVLRFAKRKSIIFWHDSDMAEVRLALENLTRTTGLKISYIEKTWLAFSIL